MALLYSWKSPNIFLHKHRSEKKIISFIRAIYYFKLVLSLSKH